MLKYRTVKELFESKWALLGAWASTDDAALQTQLFQLYEAVNAILSTHGIDPFSAVVDYTRVELVESLKQLEWSMLPSNELERRD